MSLQEFLKWKWHIILVSKCLLFWMTQFPDRFLDHMKDFGDDYEAAISGISSQHTEIPFFSSVTGKRITEAEALGAPYWRQNLESPVLFHTAIQACLFSRPQNHLFLEIGPHSALSGPLRQIFKDKDPSSDLSYLPTLLRSKDCTESMLKSIGNLHLQGVSINFNFLSPAGNVLTDLPLYQWQHDNVFWKEARLTQDWFVNIILRVKISC